MCMFFFLVSVPPFLIPVPPLLPDARAYLRAVLSLNSSGPRDPQPEGVYGEKNSRAMVTELVAFTLPLLIVW